MGVGLKKERDIIDDNGVIRARHFFRPMLALLAQARVDDGFKGAAFFGVAKNFRPEQLAVNRAFIFGGGGGGELCQHGGDNFGILCQHRMHSRIGIMHGQG